jgi:hypothetical protein
MAVTMKITVFWDVTPCSLYKMTYTLEECLPFKAEDGGNMASETTTLYQITQRHIPVNSDHSPPPSSH